MTTTTTTATTSLIFHSLFSGSTSSSLAMEHLINCNININIINNNISSSNSNSSNLNNITLNNNNKTSNFYDNNVDVEEGEEDKCLVFRFVFYTVIMGTLNILGILGNCLSIVVLQKDQHNKVATFLLQSLSAADTSVLLISFIVLSFIYGFLPFAGLTRVSSSAIPYVIKYIHPFGYMTQCVTVWMTVLLALNRFIAIVKPFMAPNICTLRKARIQVAVVVTLSIALNVPRFFQYSIYTYDLCEKGFVTPVIAINETVIGQRSVFGVVYTNIIYTICVLVIPLILLLVMNTCLIRELKFHPSKAAGPGGGGRRGMMLMKKMRPPAALPRQLSFSSPPLPEEDSITFIMVIIIVVFLCCHTPDRVFQIFRDFFHVDHGIVCGSTLYYVSSVCNLLIAVNSSSNFLIYYMLRKRFRRILLQKLCAWRRLRKHRHQPSFLEDYDARGPLRRNTESTLIGSRTESLRMGHTWRKSGSSPTIF